MCCCTGCHSGMESISWFWLCNIFPGAANELQSFQWPLYQHKGPVLPVATANLLTWCRRESSSTPQCSSHTYSIPDFALLFLTCTMRGTVYLLGFKVRNDQLTKPDSLFSCLSVGCLQWTSSCWVRAKATPSPLRTCFTRHSWQEKQVRDGLIFRLRAALGFHIMRVLFTCPYKCPTQ